MTTSTTPPALADLAALAGGVLLISRALEAGWSRDRLRDELRNGSWIQACRGAWVSPGTVSGLPLRVRALQAKHPCLIASHSLAAALHGIETLSSATDFICLCGSAHRHRIAGVAVHRPTHLPEVMAVQHGIRTTTLRRTLVDLACCRSLREAVVSIDCALNRRHVQLEQLARELAALPRQHGIASARRALWLADPRSESAAETVARLLLREIGLRPRAQVAFRGPWGEYRVDLVVELEAGLPGLGVEIEGFIYHGSPVDHQRDVHRFNQLGAVPELGRVLRFTRDDVFLRPRWMLRRIEVALEELRAQGGVS